ncbi:MAG: hypothetical protein JWN07_172 [Hyphomicrobiales bacterium]|nr:hypothetical protein [Hyphomicrobiales bacterium]
MNQVRVGVSDIELCAYLDSELPADRRADIEASLARHPESRAKLDAWRRQGHQLRATFGRIAQEPLPRQLTASLVEPVKISFVPQAAPKSTPLPQPTLRAAEPALRAPGATPRNVWRNVGLALLGFSAVAGIAASGLLRTIHSPSEPQALLAATSVPGFGLTRHAAEAHAAFAPQGGRWLDVRSADAAVLTTFAVQAGLDARLPAPPAGLRLLGLRMTPGDGGLAGLALFESDKSGPVSLYVTRAPRGAVPGIVLRETSSLTIATFTLDGTAYALTGAASRDQMVDWASALRMSLLQPRSLRGS